jgi:hypothetical protein
MEKKQRPTKSTSTISRAHLTVITGGMVQPTGDHVCTWCGKKFESHRELALHWMTSAECYAQKYVSNQTQSKYNDRNGEDE